MCLLQVLQYPCYYDGHVALIAALREAGELLEARNAREEMNKKFQLTPSDFYLIINMYL